MLIQVTLHIRFISSPMSWIRIILHPRIHQNCCCAFPKPFNNVFYVFFFNVLNTFSCFPVFSVSLLLFVLFRWKCCFREVSGNPIKIQMEILVLVWWNWIWYYYFLIPKLSYLWSKAPYILKRTKYFYQCTNILYY